MTSKVRVILMKHFLEHPGERFYLRQLERLLEVPLTPARRELIRFKKMGLLKVEREANLKFFRLNEGFENLAELKKLVGIEVPVIAKRPQADEAISKNEIALVASLPRNDKTSELSTAKEIGDSPQKAGTVPNFWLAPVLGLITLLIILQAGLFYIWTHPIIELANSQAAGDELAQKTVIATPSKDSSGVGQTTLATDSHVMSSGSIKLESGGFGGWQ